MVLDTSSKHDLLKRLDKSEEKVKTYQLPDKRIVPATSSALGENTEEYHKREIVGADLAYSHAQEKFRVRFYSGVSRENHLQQWK